LRGGDEGAAAMTDWVVIVTPLLVLPIVLLFRFVGCGGPKLNDEPIVEQVPSAPPRYRDYILPDPDVPNLGSVKNYFVVPKAEDVIAYWRLVDTFGIVAIDEKGFQHGTYHTVASPIVEQPNGEAGSENANPGGSGIVKLASKGLIDSDTKKKGATFLGGFVEIPVREGLYTAEFTIEAWYSPAWGINLTGYEHTLFSAGAPTANSSPRTGFSLYVDRQNRWRLRLAPAGEITLSSSAPFVDLKDTTRTHVALTMKANGAQKQVRLYVNAVEAGHADVGYVPPNGPLLIAIADKPDIDGLQAYRPFVGTIQEVVLHNKALTAAEIENHVDINRPRL
jgi:hypothetical protein